MAVASGPDAREHPRARARIRVEYHFGSTTGLGHTSDISEGGMFLECDRAAQQGTRVYLRIHLPGSRAGDPLKIIGSVTRADRSKERQGMGIHFEVAYSRTRETLADFVHGLLLHPTTDAIRVLDGATEDRPSYGVQLVAQGDRQKMLSATEVESAFAFDTGERQRVVVGESRAFKLILTLAVVLLSGYLVYKFILWPVFW